MAPVPSLTQSAAKPIDVVALRGGQAAARVADEDHDRAIGFLHRDRMTLAIIVGNARRHDLAVVCLQAPSAAERPSSAPSSASV